MNAGTGNVGDLRVANLPPGASRNRRQAALLRALGVAALVALASLGAPQAAVAHGGPIVLDVDQDGLGGVIVSAVYEEDGHPVSEILDPVLTATSEGGDIVGPIPLVSAPEGEGFWVSAEPLLSDGTWEVTIEITEPSAAEVEKTIEFVTVDQAPVGDGTASAADTSTDPVDAGVIVGLGAVVLLAAGVAVAVVVRNSRREKASQ